MLQCLNVSSELEASSLLNHFYGVETTMLTPHRKWSLPVLSDYANG